MMFITTDCSYLTIYTAYHEASDHVPYCISYAQQFSLLVYFSRNFSFSDMRQTMLGTSFQVHAVSYRTFANDVDS